MHQQFPQQVGARDRLARLTAPADPVRSDAPPPTSGRWLRGALVCAAYAVVLLAVSWRVLLKDQVCGWDCLNEYWPDLVFQSRALGDGQLPLWNPYTLGGYAFHADPQAGLLTPVNWLCIVISWLFGTGAYLIELKVLLLFYAGLLGMHVLVWRWTRSHLAAAIAACTFVFGAPMLVHKNSALIWPLLVMPWALVASDAFRQRPSLRRAILLGAAAGCAAVSHPQGALYVALVLGLYVGYQLVAESYASARAHRLRTDLVAAARRFGPGAACAVAVAGTWTLLVYLPTWSTVDTSARAGRTLAWALSDPLLPRSLAELFAPGLDTSWMQDIYLGPLALIVTAWLALRDPAGRFWLGVAVLSVVLALGAHGHVLPWLANHVPGFGLFRIAYRYKLITGFACAAGLGLGIGAIARSRPARRDAVVLVVLAAAWTVTSALIASSLPRWSAVVVVAALCAAVLDRPQRRRLCWIAVLAVATLVDLWRAGDTKLSILEPRPALDKGSELIAQMPGIARDWRFAAVRHSGATYRMPVPYHASLLHDVRELSGYPQPLVPQRTVDVLNAARRQPALLAHFNTKYFIGNAPAGARPIAGTPIRVLDGVAPVARLYPRAELLPAREMLARLSRLAPASLGAALVDPADHPPALPAAQFAPVDGRVVTFDRSRLVLDIDAPAAGILVVNEAWSPGWRARIDGASATLFRANYMLRALIVPAGHHRIELAYASPYRVTLLLGLLGGLLVLVVACVPWRALDRCRPTAPRAS